LLLLLLSLHLFEEIVQLSKENGHSDSVEFNDRSTRPQVFLEDLEYLEKIDEIEFKRIDFAAKKKKIHQPVHCSDE
jgi:hypothetical protein